MRSIWTARSKVRAGWQTVKNALEYNNGGHFSGGESRDHARRNGFVKWLERGARL